MYVAHRQMREDQILEQLQDGEPKTSWQIMENIYGDSIDKRLRRAADGNVQAHLKSLQKSGIVKASRGQKKRSNPATVARDKAKEKANRKIIQQGKRLDKAQRAKILAQQENPPTDVWKKPPTYQLR